MSLPSRPELAALPLHVIARDFPETLAIFRRFGVDLPRRGGDSLAEVCAADAGAVLDAVAVAIAWREER